MRNPIKKHVSKNNDELKNRAALSEKLGNQAPLKYTNEPNKKEIKPKPTLKINIDELNTTKIYAENCKTKQKNTLYTNKFKKAVLFYIAKKKGVTIQKLIEEEFIDKMVKTAKKEGFTEETAEEIFKHNLIK